MAQVTESVAIQTDWLVNYLTNALDDLAEADLDWLSLNDAEQLRIRLEWPIVVENMHRLLAMCETPSITPELCLRCADVQSRWAASQPVVDRLLAD